LGISLFRPDRDSRQAHLVILVQEVCVILAQQLRDKRLVGVGKGGDGQTGAKRAAGAGLALDRVADFYRLP
jgi:hypothetical protein